MNNKNLHNLLDKVSKRCFTLEQTLKLADYFGVTVEELTGVSKRVENRTALGLATLIVSLLENHDIYHFEHKVKEEIYEPQGGYECDIREESITYHAFYFPSYFSPQAAPVHEYWYEEMEYDARTLGNRIATNEQVNMFLDRFMSNFDKHEGGFLDDETYRIVTNAFLDAIKESKSKKKTGADSAGV